MRIVRFLKALWRYVLFGKRVSFQDYIYRLSKCNNCINLNTENWTCERCGCYVDKKCKMNTETCPNKIWY